MTMTSVKYRSDHELTNNTPHLSLTDKIWSVFSEYFLENLLCYENI